MDGAKLVAALKSLNPGSYIPARSFHQALLRPSSTAGQILKTVVDHAEWVDPPGYVLHGSSAIQAAPADSTAYYFGGLPTLAPSTSGSNRRVFVPAAGVVKNVVVYSLASGTAGSNESWTMSVRKNDTTSYTIAAVAASTASRTWNGLSGGEFSVASGDYLEITTTTPAWATNPTNVYYECWVYIEPV